MLRMPEVLGSTPVCLSMKMERRDRQKGGREGRWDGDGEAGKEIKYVSVMD